MADPAFVINGTSYPVPDNLTLGELAEIERITGQGYDLEKPGAAGTLALAYIAVKRVDPTARLEDIQMLKADDLTVEGTDGGAVLPPAGGVVSSGSDEPSKESSELGLDEIPAATPAFSGTSG